MPARRSASRRISAVCLALVVALTVLALVPGTRSAATIALGAATVVAAVVGVSGFGRAHLWAGVLLVGALLAQLIGLILFVRDGGLTERFDTFPTASDDWFIAALAPLILALALLAIPGLEQPWSSLLDACIVAVALALVLWLTLFDTVRPTWPSWQSKTLAFVYMLAYVAVLALSVLMAGSDTRRVRVGALFAVGTTALVFASFKALPHPTPTPTPRAEDGVYIGFAISRLVWSAAVLDPTLVPRDPAERRPTLTPRAWTILMTIAAVLGPVILFVQDVRGRLTDGPGQTAVALVLFGSVAARLALAMWEGLRAAATERTLRRTGTLLLSAGNLGEVAAGLARAGTELTASRIDTDVVLLLDHRPDGSPEGSPMVDPSRWRTVLAYPLAAGSGGDVRTAGTLIAASSRSSLAALDGPLRILADQAALAVDRLKSQREVRQHEKEAYFRTLVQNMSDVIFIVEADGTIRYASPSAVRMLGPRAAPGVHLAELAAEGAEDAVRDLLAHPRAGPVDLLFAGADGSVVDSETSCADLRREPTVGALAVTLHDVTEQRRLLARLRNLAHQDPLSGLANRRRFLEAVDEALAPEAAGARPVAVMMLDVDDFKQVNDTLGHAAGDELIQRIALRLASSVRAADTVARLGGDEFAVLVTTAHSVAELDQLADRIVTSFREPVVLDSGPLTVSVSGGLSVVTAPFRTHELLRQADIALYAAKGAGKRRWHRHGA